MSPLRLPFRHPGGWIDSPPSVPERRCLPDESTGGRIGRPIAYGIRQHSCETVKRLKPARRNSVIDTQLLDFDWSVAGANLVHVAVAYLIALPIGWDRERSGEGVGLRTFPLVAVASCGYLLIARDLAIGNEDAQSRVLQGLLGGIGFIGGGAILKEGGTVRGTATVASIWNTAAIGVAVAFDRFEIANVLGVINLLTLQWSKAMKRAVDGGDEGGE